MLLDGPRRRENAHVRAMPSPGRLRGLGPDSDAVPKNALLQDQGSRLDQGPSASRAARARTAAHPGEATGNPHGTARQEPEENRPWLSNERMSEAEPGGGRCRMRRQGGEEHECDKHS
eukprot:1988683-Pyramimonas_sp.AAC.1